MAKKESLSAPQLLADIKKRKFAPIYFLQGAEPYFIDKIADALVEAVLTPEERDFNLTLLYGADVDMSEVVTAARRYPMMSQYQLVVVREAQLVEHFELLENYTRQPMPTTILVICYKYKTYDSRKKLMKDIAEKGIIFESKKLYDRDVMSFVLSYVAGAGLSIDGKAAQMMTEFVGADLARLAGELDKLCLSPDLRGGRITADLVERNIGISKEYNSFELLRAVVSRDVYRSNLIARQLSFNPKTNPIQVITATLFNFFANLMLAHYAPDKSEAGLARELGLKSSYAARDYLTALRHYNAFKVMQIITILRETDARSKGFGGNVAPDELLRECLFKILH